MKKIIFVFSAILLTTLLASTAQAFHSWGLYHWARKANPLSLKLGDNLTSTSWKAHLATASADWSASSVLDTTVVAGLGGKNCKANLGRAEVCNRKYGNNGWLGLAQIWISSNHITQGLVKMNDTYFSLPKYNNPNEKLHVVCQEVGHIFGLDHQSEDGSSQNTCMDYFSNTGANASSTLSTHPNTHDYEQLETIYAHLDATNTSSSTAGSANAAVDLEDPKAWGKLIRESADKKTSVFERDLGKGNKIFTFVTWAE
mgnify:CR=1 FL=1